MQFIQSGISPLGLIIFENFPNFSQSQAINLISLGSVPEVENGPLGSVPEAENGPLGLIILKISQMLVSPRQSIPSVWDQSQRLKMDLWD